MADYGSSPRFGGLKIMPWTHVQSVMPKIPAGGWRRRGRQQSLSHSLSAERMHPMAKTFFKNVYSVAENMGHALNVRYLYNINVKSM